MRSVGAVGRLQGLERRRKALCFGKHLFVGEPPDMLSEISGFQPFTLPAFIAQQIPQRVRVMRNGFIAHELSILPIRRCFKAVFLGQLSRAFFIDQTVIVCPQGGLDCKLGFRCIVQLINAALYLAAFHAGQHHGIGKHTLLGLLMVETECIMLPRSAQKHVPFPQTMRSIGTGKP